MLLKRLFVSSHLIDVIYVWCYCWPFFPCSSFFRSVPSRVRARARHDRRLPLAGDRGDPRSRELHARTHRGTVDRRRSEEHTSELQSREKLVCRLLFEKKKCLNCLEAVEKPLPVAFK